MPRNVEIKARLPDVERTVSLVTSITGGSPEIIEQEDTFFNVPKGRLKLRILSSTRGQLIFYERADQAGPKTSLYSIVETDRPLELRALLEAACGTRNIVRKTRQLYLAGRARIHIDDVESLGHFLEIEVVLGESEEPESGVAEAQKLMTRLGIGESELVEKAYVDLLEEKRQ